MKYRLFFYLIFAAFFCVAFNSCDQEENLPSLITAEINQVTNIAANCRVEITSKGTYEIIRQGACWSTKPSPTISDNIMKDDSDLTTFSVTLTNLLPNTKYYVRAYATNALGTGYGNEIEFQTTGNTPVLSITQIGEKTFNSIKCGGNITSDGGDVIVARGVCWAENPQPSIKDNKTENGNGTGLFTSEINNLKSNTTYYIRAYATNSVGTTYSDVLSFTLWLNIQDQPIKDIDGNTYHTIRIGDQIWTQENLRVKKLGDGTSLTPLTNQSDWINKSAPGYYINVTNEAFGYIYNGYAISTNNSICPKGWHVPTESEWEALINYLGGSSVAGGRMKESSNQYWTSPNVGANNSSGFTALPNGYIGSDGTSHDQLQDASFMIATFDYSGNPKFAIIENNFTSVFIEGTSAKVSGASIRCIKD